MTADSPLEFDRIDVHDGPGDYRLLVEHCAHIAGFLDEPSGAGSRSAEFIHSNAMSLASAITPSHDRSADVGPDVPVVEMLRLLVDHWPQLATGRLSGEELMADRPELWRGFMHQWPLGSYGRLTARAAIECGATNGDVVEVGAGSGHASVALGPAVTGCYIRTDLGADLAPDMPGTYEQFDINRRPRWSGLQGIVGSNVLHCAVDKRRTLDRLKDALAPGGHLVLGEGVPFTKPDVPWALTYLCGLFAGWWDIGGFLERSVWLSLLADVGLQTVEVRRLVASDHDLGGVIVAQRPLHDT